MATIYCFSFLDTTSVPGAYIVANNLVQAVHLYDLYAQAWGEDFTGPRAEVIHTMEPVGVVDENGVPNYLVLSSLPGQKIEYHGPLPQDPSDDLYVNFTVNEDGTFTVKEEIILLALAACGG